MHLDDSSYKSLIISKTAFNYDDVVTYMLKIDKQKNVLRKGGRSLAFSVYNFQNVSKMVLYTNYTN